MEKFLEEMEADRQKINLYTFYLFCYAAALVTLICVYCAYEVHLHSFCQ